jgi:hypothetical protein
MSVMDPHAVSPLDGGRRISQNLWLVAAIVSGALLRRLVHACISLRIRAKDGETVFPVADLGGMQLYRDMDVSGRKLATWRVNGGGVGPRAAGF